MTRVVASHLTSLTALYPPRQVAFDKLMVDNADQKADFVDQMARANLTAASRRHSSQVIFDSQMARVNHDNAASSALLNLQMSHQSDEMKV